MIGNIKSSLQCIYLNLCEFSLTISFDKSKEQTNHQKKKEDIFLILLNFQTLIQGTAMDSKLSVFSISMLLLATFGGTVKILKHIVLLYILGQVASWGRESK